LILEDPPLSAQGDPPFDPKLWREEARARILKERGQTLKELIAERRAQSPNWSQDQLLHWAEAKRQVSPHVAEMAFSLPLRWRSPMRRIDCPILLLTGESDAGAHISPKVAEEVSLLCRDGRVVHIQNAGHNIRRDQFERYLATVTAFLAEVGAD
jgi:pimeloyl-ACP methyl ester carboxylesterase